MARFQRQLSRPFTKSDLAAIKTLVKDMKASGNPEFVELAKHAKAGLRIFLHLCHCHLKIDELKPIPGIEVTVSAESDTKSGPMRFANFISSSIKGLIDAKQPRAEADAAR
jgi:hypothetical protein